MFRAVVGEGVAVVAHPVEIGIPPVGRVLRKQVT